MEAKNTKVHTSEIKLTTGQAITPAELAQAIQKHSQGTGIKIQTIADMVAKGELLPVQWAKGGITLVYNSPNGL